MPKKYQFVPNESPASMASAHSYILNAQNDQDEDDVLCPICESECTCDNRRNNAPATPPMPYPLVAPQPLHPLKIKLTVPASMRTTSSTPSSSTGPIFNTNGGDVTPTSGPSSLPYPAVLDPSLPKRRGRPPKHIVAAREAAKAAWAEAQIQAGLIPAASTSTFQAKPPPPRAAARGSRARGTTGNATATRKTTNAANKNTKKKAPARPAPPVIYDSRWDDEETEDETPSGSQFPTFVSASVVESSIESSSAGSDSSSSSSSSDDEDSEIEKEEEEEIIRQENARYGYDKARVKRELLGGDDPGAYKRNHNNNWEIRPRKKSVGASGAEDDMDVDDSDSGEDASDDDSGDEDEEEEGDGDGGVKGPGMSVEENGAPEEEERRYKGVATGWSDSEESSFDAEVFFKGLNSDSEQEQEQDQLLPSSLSQNWDSDADSESTDDEMDVDDVGSGDFVSRRGSGLDFGLDTGVFFSSGLSMFDVGSSWELDFMFEGEGGVSSVSEMDQEMSDAPPSPSGESSSTCKEEDELSELGSSDGDTTEEELVGEDGLPNQRAMKFFRWPTPPPPRKLAVDAINPLRTVSPERAQDGAGGHSSAEVQSPKPADILAIAQRNSSGFWTGGNSQSQEHSEGEEEAEAVGRIGGARKPVMGCFERAAEEGEGEGRIAVIDGKSAVAMVPSPYPRKGKKKRSEHEGREGSLANAGFSSPVMSALPGSSTSVNPQTPTPGGEDLTDFSVPSSDQVQPETIDLADVLDASFLHASGFFSMDEDATLSSAASDDDGHLKSLSRWERIPIGTFRQTRQLGSAFGMGAGAGSEVESGFNGYSGDSSMLWPQQPSTPANRASTSTAASGSSRRNSKKAARGVIISPVILPVRDGDQTPTQPFSLLPPQNNKSRKESRREKKMKRKALMSNGYSPAQHNPHHGHGQQKYRYHHQHHPNSKKGPTAGGQRNNFSSGSGGGVPPLGI